MKKKRINENKWHLSYTIPDFYKKYYRTRRDLKVARLTKSQYKDVINFVLKDMVNAIIEERHSFKIPNRMGYLYIKQMDIKAKTFVDWPTSHEVGKVVYRNNLDTGRKVFKMFWNRTRRLSHFKNRTLYRFTFSRANKSKLKNHIKECYSNPKKKNYNTR